MTMNVYVAAARIRNQLRDTEAKLDAALNASARLMTTMVEARTIPEVEVHTGQKALLRLAEAQRYLLNGSNSLFRVHDELVKIGQEMMIMDEHGPTGHFGLAEVDELKEAA